jgi:hypothetical protein
MSTNSYTNGHTVRKINFGAGPAQLPLEVWLGFLIVEILFWIFKVLENIQAEFLDYNGSGSNIMGIEKILFWYKYSFFFAV